MVAEVEKQNLSNIAIKNSGYSTARALILKLGGLFFTIIIARILLPELFGIYALAMSVITIFMTFTELGVNGTFLRYFSEALGKKDKNLARGYFKYLVKIKSFLIIGVIFVLIFSSKFLAYNFYDKPLLFYPLIFACLFILMESFMGFFTMSLFATKNLKPLPFLELLYQITRISFSVLAILVLSDEFKVAGLFVSLALSAFINLLLILLISYKKDKEYFFGSSQKIDKKRILNFLGPMSIAGISLVFFTSIDILMMGKFVGEAYLGYYRAALSLVLTLAALFSFSDTLLPIFTQINGKRFERGLQKTLKYILMFALPAIVGILFLGKYILLLIYGNEYLLATLPLYVLSFMIFITPLTSLYTMIFQSKEKTKILAKSALISLVVNIILNIIFIKLFLGNFQKIIIFVGLATIISRLVYLGILIFSGKKILNLKIRKIKFKEIIFSAGVMGIFLYFFNQSVKDMNFILGGIEIMLGAGIYFASMYLLKGIEKEDFSLIKGVFRQDKSF